VNDETLPELDCAIIAGGANNVLAEPRHGAELDARGILYAPDFCINSGGLISLEEEILGHDDDRMRRRVRSVGDQIRNVLARAAQDEVTTTEAATTMATERLRAMSRIRPTFVAS
jgi:leucine dehydrogenase